jgi:predicted DNA binding CopG/RHH family protein
MKKKTSLVPLNEENGLPQKNLSAERKRVREYARATMRKDKRVNIRISQRDLMELQRKAVHEGLP